MNVPLAGRDPPPAASEDDYTGRPIADAEPDHGATGEGTAAEFDEWIAQQREKLGLGPEDSIEEMTARQGEQWGHERLNFHPSRPRIGDDEPEHTAGGKKNGHTANGAAPPDSERLPFPTPHIIRASDLDEHTLPPRPWLLGRMLLRGDITGLVAGGAIGKSTLLLGTCLSLITGRDLIGETPYEKGRCWLHNAEDGIEEQRRRLIALRIHHDIAADAIDGQLILTSGLEHGLILAQQTPYGVVQTPHVARSIEFIRDNRLPFAGFDPFADLQMGVNENDNAAVKAVMRAFKQVAHHSGAAVGIALHTGKPPRGGDFDPTDANMARGAKAITDGFRITQQLTNMTEKDAEALGVPEDEMLLYLRRDDGKINFTLKVGEALAWYKRHNVILANGDHVGVLAPHPFKKGNDTVEGIADRADEKRIAEVVAKRWDESAPLSAYAQSGGRHLPRVMAALEPPMKAGRAKKLMENMIARSEIVEQVTGKRTGLRLPHQGKNT
jgi:RecA-family ATPase